MWRLAMRSSRPCVPPSEEEQACIHDDYVNELLRGAFLPSSRERLRDNRPSGTARRVQGVILGGTELPLILRQESVARIPLLDTTQIHVSATVSEILL